MKLKEKLGKKRVSRKWDERFYVMAYKLCQEGLTNGELSESLGVSKSLVERWIKEKPGFAYAVEEGRKRLEKGGSTLQNYIFQRLPPELRRLWKKIKRIETEGNSVIRIQRLLDNKGEDVRKHLFLHVLSTTRFNATQACKRLCITRHTVDRWVEEDMHFAQLIEEIHNGKKDFCEGALMDLVEERNPQVVMMVAKSLLRDRGYGEKMEIEHSGSVNHSHTDLSVLSLPLQQKVLAELRELEYKNRNEVSEDIIDVTPVSTKLLENKRE